MKAPVLFSPESTSPRWREDADEGWSGSFLRRLPRSHQGQAGQCTQARRLGRSGSRNAVPCLVRAITWLDDQRPDEAELRKIAAQLGTGDLNVDRCISQFQSLLRLPQVAAVLSKRTYQPPRSLPFSPLVQAELPMVRARSTSTANAGSPCRSMAK